MNNENKEELIALIDYLVHHNVHHNEELKELALKLDPTESTDAYKEILDAIKAYDTANSILKNALEKVK